MSRSDPSSRPQPKGASVSLRLRLTLLIVSVFAVIQVTLGVMLLIAMRQALDEEAASRLVDHAQMVARALADGPVSAQRLKELTAGDVGGGAAGGAAAGGVNWALYDEGGVVISDAPARTASDAQIVMDALTAGEVVRRVRPVAIDADQGERHSRAVAVPFTGPAGKRYALVAEGNVPLIDHAMTRINRIVVLATPFGLLAAAVAAWYVAAVAVKPLVRLRQIAQHMNPDSLGDPIKINSNASEIKRLQDDLNSAMGRLEAGYQVQERFIANVSHEIKTPIATVLTEAQTLGNRASLPAEVRQFIVSAEDEMRRLGQLVESFLLLARVREGKGIFTVSKAYPINELVMDSVEQCGPIASQQDVKLVPSLLNSEAEEVLVRGDPALLRTLIDNLVRNALRFSPRGRQVDIAISLEGKTACVRVRDYGPGLPPDVLAHVFDRFSQAKADQRLGRGSGLGLEIAKGIAELHGGDIQAKNLPDGGCAFVVCLPWTTEPDASAAAKQATTALGTNPSRASAPAAANASRSN